MAGQLDVMTRKKNPTAQRAPLSGHGPDPLSGATLGDPLSARSLGAAGGATIARAAKPGKKKK